MKRLFLLLLCCVLILAGCRTQTEPVVTIPDAMPETVPTDTTEATEQINETEVIIPKDTTLLSVSVPAVTEEYTLEDGTPLFSYTSQHMQLVLPDENVADRVILDFLNRVDNARVDAESVYNAAQTDYNPDGGFYPYFYQVIYSPTRIDHGVLSLFGIQNSYSGSMHSNLSCVAVNYDLTTGDVLTLGSIMHMDGSKEDFINIIIDKLGAIAEEKYLFDGYEEGVRNRLGGDENLYENFYFTTTGLAFAFAPYEIAPYSSGIITVEIPYEELPGLIYDGYFPAERERIQGSMHTSNFAQTDMTRFNNMAEITLAAGKEVMVVYPEGNVEDVRITIASDGINMPAYTVFAALEMSAKNAVVISLEQEDIAGITITYSADGSTASIPLG